MEPPQDFKSLQEGLQKSLVSTVKTVNRIAAEDLGFQRTVNPDVADQLDDKSARILDLSTRLLKSAASACGIKAPAVEDVEDIDMNWRGVVDVVDTVLEKADTALDEYTGLIKRKEPPTGDTAPDPKKSKSAKVVRNANISKPQVHFDVQPDNFPTEPWKPILSNKPHSTVSLEDSLVTFKSPNGTLQYKHPYETEITDMEYPKRVYKKAEPIPYKPIDGTEATWVDTYEGVLEMLEHLKEAKEIAVDLEHHDFRTYTGLVSLMQVSTRDQDWIVDTLKPWRHKLEVLNEVFADPNIVKVFHGAYMDMVWLQRDLGLYVNGLFDTYFACELLAYPGRSLAYLLSNFVGFIADKQYQLADWRMRPIPKEMMYYARSDTHYLLYIYDQVRNDLVASSDRSNPETDLIQRALDKSKDVSLYRHEHPAFDEATGEGSRGWYGYVLKNGHLSFDAEQFATFRALWKWRDVAARGEDENPNFVMGSTNIAHIARTNPPDMKALHSLLPPNSPIAKPRLNEIWEYIQKERAKGGPSLLQYLTSLAPDSLKRNGAPKGAKSTTLPQIDGDVIVSRLTRSQLFGDMAISSRWEESSKASARDNDQVPFPWQRFIQQGSDSDAIETNDPEVKAEEPQEPDAEAAAADAESAEEQDQEFTLKRGKKRKAESSAPSPTSSEVEAEDEDELMEDGDDGVLRLDDPVKRSKKLKKKISKDKKKNQADFQAERAQKNAQRKAERKAAKAQKKQDKKDNNAQDQDEQKKFSAVPFDYSKASSVMNAGRNGQQQTDQSKKGAQKQVFDPYAKTAEDGLKGARKAPPIRGERSATFKK